MTFTDKSRFRCIPGDRDMAVSLHFGPAVRLVGGPDISLLEDNQLKNWVNLPGGLSKHQECQLSTFLTVIRLTRHFSPKFLEGTDMSRWIFHFEMVIRVLEICDAAFFYSNLTIFALKPDCLLWNHRSFGPFYIIDGALMQTIEPTEVKQAMNKLTAQWKRTLNRLKWK